ncbi:MAG: glycogen debranching enzyme GlgX [Gemmatimonadales bacterium]|nr:MAG: glycogen debranching enzyme GlgX [Gemmatimonadales bacterium]
MTDSPPTREAWPGSMYPLGATWDGNGVNFALFSRHATAVELCLFDAETGLETHRIPVREHTAWIWHTYVPGLAPGQRYGYRVHGPHDPGEGHRFNPAKLLLDPYAKALDGPLEWSDRVFGYRVGDPGEDLSLDPRDSAPVMPRCVVTDAAYDWEGVESPRIPWHETVLYEAHVKGMTARHPEVPEELRGTFAGMAHPAVIGHLKELGVTTVELMPIHYFVDERHLVERGLRNYWGYNSIGFFAPDCRYGTGDDPADYIRQFRDMVKAYHREGMEIVLDVVYNHTAEGNQLGPTLSFRGIDNRAYYRLSEEDRRYYVDYTGCGNTLNMLQPRVVQGIMDSLRYWVGDMGVDGFRFDLAPALAREFYDVNMLSTFLQIVQQDPLLAETKLIAEPWDVGPGGYQVGNFPPGWVEWNGKYRNTMRDYWRGEEARLGEFALRLTGSSDLYQGSSRNPSASVNLVTVHDGFTLHDLVSYNEKHNEANGWDNTDGTDDNRSWNCGVEGPTSDPDILELRARQRRNLMATLLLSQGVPLILGGDELGRTQGGNNNAYCQDNEISWLDWENPDEAFLAFTRDLVRFRKNHPVFRHRRWPSNRFTPPDEDAISWYGPSGEGMSEEDWEVGHARSVAMFLSGDAFPSTGPRGQRIEDDSFLVFFNADVDAVRFVIPESLPAERWECCIDTATGVVGPAGESEGYLSLGPGGELDVGGRSLRVFRRV